MIDLYRLPLTNWWLTECLEQYGIQWREPVILWLSVLRMHCSGSRPRSLCSSRSAVIFGRSVRAKVDRQSVTVQNQIPSAPP